MIKDFSFDIPETGAAGKIGNLVQTTLSAPSTLQPGILVDTATDAITAEISQLVDQSGVMQQISQSVSSATEIIKTANSFITNVMPYAAVADNAARALSLIPNLDPEFKITPSPKQTALKVTAGFTELVMSQINQVKIQAEEYYNRLKTATEDTSLEGLQTSVDTILKEVDPLLTDILKKYTGYSIGDIRAVCSKGFQLAAMVKRLSMPEDQTQKTGLQKHIEGVKEAVRQQKQYIKDKAQKQLDNIKVKAKNASKNTKKNLEKIANALSDEVKKDITDISDTAVNSYAQMQQDFSKDKVLSNLKEWAMQQNAFLLNAFNIILIQDAIKQIQNNLPRLESMSPEGMNNFIMSFESLFTVLETIGINESSSGIRIEDLQQIVKQLQELPSSALASLQTSVVSRVSAAEMTSTISSLKQSVKMSSVTSLKNAGVSNIQQAVQIPKLLSQQVINNAMSNAQLSSILSPIAGKVLIYDEVLSAIKTIIPVLNILKQMVKLVSNYRLNKQYAREVSLSKIADYMKDAYSKLGLDKQVNLNDQNIFTIRTDEMIQWFNANVTDITISEPFILTGTEGTAKIIDYIKAHNIHPEKPINPDLNTLVYILNDNFSDGLISNISGFESTDKAVFYNAELKPLTGSEIQIHINVPQLEASTGESQFDELMGLITITSDEFEGTQTIQMSDMNLCEQVTLNPLETDMSEDDCAIIEFGDDWVKADAVEFSLNVHPGESITDKQVIANIVIGGQTLPLKSIFSEGTVKSSGDSYFHVLNNCTRHIVISGYKETAGTDYDQSIIEGQMDKMKQSGDLAQLILNLMPYTALPSILTNRIMSAGIPNGYGQFQSFIDRYTDMVSQYQDEMLAAAGPDGIAAANTPAKMKEQADLIMSIRNNMIQDAVTLYSDILPQLNCIGDANYTDCSGLAQNKVQKPFEGAGVDNIAYNNYYLDLLSLLDMSNPSEWTQGLYNILTEIINRRADAEKYNPEALINDFNNIYRQYVNPSENNPFTLMTHNFSSGDITYNDVYDFIKKQIIVFRSEQKDRDFFNTLTDKTAIDEWLLNKQSELLSHDSNKSLLSACKQLSNMFIYLKNNCGTSQINESWSVSKEELTDIFNSEMKLYHPDMENPFNDIKNLYESLLNSGSADVNSALLSAVRPASETLVDIFYAIIDFNEDNIDENIKKYVDNQKAYKLTIEEAYKLNEFWNNAITALQSELNMDAIIDEYKSYVTGLTNSVQWPEPTNIIIKGKTYRHYLFTFPNEEKEKVDDMEIQTPPEDVAAPETPEITPESLNEDIKVPNNKEITILDYEYWLVWMTNATMLTLLPAFWADGFDIPPFMTPLKLPAIYIPVAPPLHIKPLKVLMVFGIGLRGLWPMPIVLCVNMGSSDIDVKLPIQMATELIKQTYEKAVEKLERQIPDIVKNMLNDLIGNSAILKKEADRYRTYLELIKAQHVENAGNIEKEFARALHGKNINTATPVIRTDRMGEGADSL